MSNVLVNESQLGTRLNHAIDNGRRGEFALLLALLSTDARDMAQFQTDLLGKNIDDQLRTKFDLAAPLQLVSDLSVDSSPVEHSRIFREGGARAFQLAQAIQSEAMVTRGSEPVEMQQVLTNCDLLTREKFIRSKSKEVGYGDAIDFESPHFVDILSKQRQMSRIMEAC
ncbi:Ribosomal S4P (gammaproteobacterial) [Shewanella psychrophila]|uniref:Ribosomal S4P (Gammaproteobacterial) n=2 Tax=Shewanella psychrophila TaxID=225848 RepID=A0A1S6HLD9_9GAMM|nr:Ribosomal S4P (gammaproteobacterial) [Shewanella psychrophila]